MPLAFAMRHKTTAILARLTVVVAGVRRQKKWWLVPFLIALLALGLLVALAGTGAAPFIYTLF